MLDEILEELDMLSDDFDRYSYLAIKAKEFSEPEGLRREENRIPACTSPFWVRIDEKDDRIYPYCSSDSVFMHGVGNIICSLFFGMDKSEIHGVERSVLNTVLEKTHTDLVRARGIKQLFYSIMARAEKQ